MDYKTWSRYEAVPLSNGIITRRTGFDYLKSPEEINAYYQEHFGVYWFNELPKTDNVYSPSSQLYGCTLAPGIPLIPNLCRRPLRSSDVGYDYSTSRSSYSYSSYKEDYSNQHNHFVDKMLDNGHSGHNNTQLTNLNLPLPRRRIFDDSGLDSDSEYEIYDNLSGNFKQETRSDNHVTLLSWIVTLVTTIVTTVTTTVTETLHLRAHKHNNHVETRIPLKQPVAVSWYQYPVLWLYKAALAVHRADVWLLWKVNSVLQVDRWGTAKQRRTWALILLLIPIIIWAAYKTYEWLGEDETSPLLDNVLSWVFAPFIFVWHYLTEFTGWSTSWLYSVFGWFDGSWISYPWIATSEWWERSEDQTVTEEAIEKQDVDWSGITSWFMWPINSVSVLFASLGSYISSAVSTLGEGAVTVYTSVAYFLSAVLFWIFDFVTGIPALVASMFAAVVSPFKSLSWTDSPPTPDYTPSAPPYESQFYQPPPATATSANWDHLLADQQLLTALVRRLITTAEFKHALGQKQSVEQAKVETALTGALEKITLEINKLKLELNEKFNHEESSVESKIGVLNQQIQDLEMALNSHKNLVAEQAAIGSKFEEFSSEQHKINEDEVISKLREQILLEMTKVKEEIVENVINLQVNQKIVTEPSPENPPIALSVELEAYINATVERLLAIYDADKIAKADYALASSGGSVLSVRCTEKFLGKNPLYHVLGYPLWSEAGNEPKVALEPGIVPGRCWAFVGNQGFLIIELSENITVTGFTLEHLPKALSLSGNIDTAPRDFHILGLESEEDDMPILLGRFTYLDNGQSLQYFDALEVDHSFKIVELVIDSNHGNLEYTCLYRFRVHGTPVRTPCMYRSYFNS